MRPEEVEALLGEVRSGKIGVDEALGALRRVPVEDLDFAQIDTHRELRQGMPEAIYAEFKSPEQTVLIARRLLDATTAPVMATRAPPDVAAALLEAFPDADYDESSGLVVLRRDEPKDLGSVLIVTGGTSDLPVAAEAGGVAAALGARVERVVDAGVAGVHRILAVQDKLAAADVVIVVAGMEGALASLVGGITPAPVIGVPTSVGYGASFDGLAALLGMLTSCAAGITVVNIDNGYGAAMAAVRLLHRMAR